MSRRRDEQREWEGNAFYEAWQRGVPEGRLSYDRMSDAFENGQSPEGYVSGICRSMEQARQQREQEAAEQAYYEEMAAMEHEQHRQEVDRDLDSPTE
jgi:hypothetical protein